MYNVLYFAVAEGIMGAEIRGNEGRGMLSDEEEAEFDTFTRVGV